MTSPQSEDDWEDDDDNLDEEFDDLVAGPPALPADSPIAVERFPDGLTIQVPPAGLLQGSKGLFAFAIIWNGFMTIFTAAVLAAVFNGKAQPGNSVWVLPLFLSLFWLVGIGILLGAINMGRRRAALAVTDGSLMAIQTGLFRSKQRDWLPGTISSIRVGPSGMEVNEVPVLELQIFDNQQRKFCLLAGRRDDELEWLAHELRSALELQP